jgi:peptide/nickel transport system substrate-binding protein
VNNARHEDAVNQAETAQGISRRSAIRLLVSSAGIVVVAACGIAPTPQAAPTAGGSSAAVAASGPSPAAKPKSGGTLRTTGANDLTTPNGHFNQGSARQSLWLTYDHLTTYDDRFQPQPMLAESWQLSNDLKELKLSLRKGVTRQSGREFTREDVKWNILAVRDPTTAGTSFVAQSNWFTTIETPDKYTIILKSDQPRPAVFDFFEYFNIIDPQQPQGSGDKTPTGGTGPFTFVEWAQGDHLTFAKNKNYWQTGRPYLDSVIYSIIKDPAAQTVALEAGSMEVVESPALRDFARYQADPK